MANYNYIDESTKKAIEDTVELVLKDTSIVVPPIGYDDVFKSEKLNYNLFSSTDPNYIDFVKQVGPAHAEMLRGVLLVEEKHVFVKNEGYDKRINFAFGHELAHWKLDWHRNILFYCSEFDLSTSSRRQLEIEANYFASRLGFMNGKFNRNLADSELTIDSIKRLSDIYGLSVTACLRSAVESELRPCALLVMKWLKSEKGYSLKVKYPVHSKSFEEKLGLLKRDLSFDPDDEMTKVLNDPIMKSIGSYTFETKINQSKESKEIKIDTWKNPFEVFALITLK